MIVHLRSRTSGRGSRGNDSAEGLAAGSDPKSWRGRNLYQVPPFLVASATKNVGMRCFLGSWFLRIETKFANTKAGRSNFRHFPWHSDGKRSRARSISSSGGPKWQQRRSFSKGWGKPRRGGGELASVEEFSAASRAADSLEALSATAQRFKEPGAGAISGATLGLLLLAESFEPCSHVQSDAGEWPAQVVPRNGVRRALIIAVSLSLSPITSKLFLPPCHAGPKLRTKFGLVGFHPPAYHPFYPWELTVG